MVRVRRTDSNTRQEILHCVQRNRRSRRLPHTIITLDNDIITPTPEIIDLEPRSSEVPVPLLILEQEIIEIQENTDDTITLTQPSTDSQYTAPGMIEEFPDNLSDCSTVSLNSNNPLAQRILATWERNAEIAPSPEIVDQCSYSPEEDDFEWVPLAHGAIAHQPDSTRKIDTIPDSAPTR